MLLSDYSIKGIIGQLEFQRLLKRQPLGEPLEEPFIEPFVSESIRQKDTQRVISYGLSSYGYDIRLSPKEFYIFRHIPGTVIDPKCFNPDNLESTPLHEDANGKYFILPGNSYGLGVSLEKINMPPDVTAIAMGKSTYARCGIHTNITPIEAAWQGHITLEFSNGSCADTRIYAEEGVVQLLFLKGDQLCKTSYAQRKGKYQNQPESVILSKV
jgi:dCTP deaminase